jgi:CDGSH-type Zn-finger protein
MTITIKVRLNGPYAIDLATTDVALVDHEGNPIIIPPEKKTLALCRCGQSETKPFCDSAHKRICWVAATEQPVPSGGDLGPTPVQG